MKKWGWSSIVAAFLGILLAFYVVAIPTAHIIQTLHDGVPVELHGLGKTYMTMPLFKEELFLFVVMVVCAVFFIRRFVLSERRQNQNHLLASEEEEVPLGKSKRLYE